MNTKQYAKQENAVNVSNDNDINFRINMLNNKNLFAGDNLPDKNLGGVSINTDGAVEYSYITMHGTTNDVTYIYTKTFLTRLNAGKYTFSIRKVDGTYTANSGATTIYLRYSNDTNIVSREISSIESTGYVRNTFTLTEDTDIYFSIYTNKTGQVFNLYSLRFQIEKGTSATSYQAYVPNLKNTTYIDNNKFSDSVNVGSEVDDSFRVNFQKGNNLFNKNTVLRKTGINSTNGALTQYDNYFTSELIKVDSNTDYYAVGATVVFGYDNSGSYIGQITNVSSAVTFNTGESSYIRLRNWWATSDTQMEEQINATMLNIGTTGLPYEAYILPSIIVDNTEFYSQEYIDNKIIGTILYEGWTHEAFTLNDNINNYKKVGIVFARSSWHDMKYLNNFIINQSGTTPCGLSAQYPNPQGTAISQAGAVIRISGTNVTMERQQGGIISSTGYSTEANAYLDVYQVIGYK